MKKIGTVYSIVDNNQPMKKSAILNTVYENYGYVLTVYSMAERTTISPERLTHPTIYFVLEGDLHIDSKEVTMTLEEAEVHTLQYIYRPANSLWGFHTEKDCVFTELILLSTSEIDRSLIQNRKGFFTGYISFKQHDSYVKQFVNDIHLKADIISMDCNTSFDMVEKGAVLLTCLEGNGEIIYKGKQMPFGTLQSFEVPSDEHLTITTEGRMKLLRIVYL